MEAAADLFDQDALRPANRQGDLASLQLESEHLLANFAADLLADVDINSLLADGAADNSQAGRGEHHSTSLPRFIEVDEDDDCKDDLKELLFSPSSSSSSGYFSSFAAGNESTSPPAELKDDRDLSATMNGSGADGVLLRRELHDEFYPPNERSTLFTLPLEQWQRVDPAQEQEPLALLVTQHVQQHAQEHQQQPQQQQPADLSMRNGGESSQCTLSDDEGRPPTCPVCGNEAGKHSYYGGQVCNSCRAFFRRSVQNRAHERFKCKSGAQGMDRVCSINSRSWKSCQACRFKKCLEAGMKVSKVIDSLIINHHLAFLGAD